MLKCPAPASYELNLGAYGLLMRTQTKENRLIIFPLFSSINEQNTDREIIHAVLYGEIKYNKFVCSLVYHSD